VAGAIASAVCLTTTDAFATVGAGVQAGTFTLAQADWSCGQAATDWLGSSGFMLEFQCDGNLVLYALGPESETPIWASGTDTTAAKKPVTLDFSASGYIKLIDSAGTIVCTMGALNPAPGGQAVVQNDGNFVFYNTSGTATWATGTYGPKAATLDYCSW
jgi:hypothetical protein